MVAADGSTPVDLEVTAGLPYARRFRVTGATSIWPVLETVEVRSQVRSKKTVASPLVFDLTPYLTRSTDAGDIVIDLELTGAETRTLVKGYYDIILSDAGIEDARAISIAAGQVKVSVLVTAASDV